MDFVEKLTYPIVGTSTVNGKYFYNYDLKKYRVDRDNGKFDRYCGTAYKLSNTKCN